MYKSLTKVILVRDQTNKSIGKNLKNTFYILDIVKYFPSDQLQAFCIQQNNRVLDRKGPGGAEAE